MTKIRKRRLKNRLKKIIRKHGFTKVEAINFYNKNKPKRIILKFLNKFYKNGGTVIFTAGLPINSEKGP